PVGKLVTRLTNDVANLNEMYRSTMVAFCQDIMLVLGIIVVLLVLDWQLALVCLAASANPARKASSVNPVETLRSE
ncbi:MAG: ABC transporter transmembrane domain-containing protein, partial [Acidobacteriota bacterium]